ncbi:MAG: hypothetical protein GX617_15895, partial [Lentisphaerae bacterium]|nr:hypothetical protein [Lentisphaerota bacterium]
MTTLKFVLSIMLVPFAVVAAEGPGWFILFGSRGCAECDELKAMWRDYGQDKSVPVMVFVDIEQGGNYQLLKRIEQHLAISQPAATFPILLVGDRMVSGVAGFFDIFDDVPVLSQQMPELMELAPVLAQLGQHRGVVVDYAPAVVAGQSVEPLPSSAGPGGGGQFLFLVQKGCERCSRQLRELRLLAVDRPGLDVQCYDIGTPDGQVMLERVRRQFAIPESDESPVPMVVWQDGYVSLRLVTVEELRKVVLTGGDVFWMRPITASEREHFTAKQGAFLGRMSFAVIVAAGLIDGFNPCAFATSLFLIGYLIYLKRRPRQILCVGASFCLGVFTTYLLFGFGLSFLIDFLASLTWVKALLYAVFGAVSLVLAVLHCRDALVVRRSGRASDMSMGLSMQNHRRIHDHIKRLTAAESSLMLPAALLLGAVVSSLELACTGQIYLPTIAAINNAGFNLRAVAFLALYNVSFILPLALITALAAAGIGMQAVARLAKRHVFST